MLAYYVTVRQAQAHAGQQVCFRISGRQNWDGHTHTRTPVLVFVYISLEMLFHALDEKEPRDWSLRCYAASQLCAAENAPGGTERLLPAVASSSLVFVTGEGNSGVQTRQSTHLKSCPTLVNTGQNPHANDVSTNQPDPNIFKRSDQLLGPRNN